MSVCQNTSSEGAAIVAPKTNKHDTSLRHVTFGGEVIVDFLWGGSNLTRSILSHRSCTIRILADDLGVRVRHVGRRYFERAGTQGSVCCMSMSICETIAGSIQVTISMRSHSYSR